MGVLRMVLAFLRPFFASRAALAAENVMLRQQLIVVYYSTPEVSPNRPDSVVLAVAVVIRLAVCTADCTARRSDALVSGWTVTLLKEFHPHHFLP